MNNAPLTPHANWNVPDIAPRNLRILLWSGVGCLGLGVAFAFFEPSGVRHALFSYLVSLCFYLSLALGTLILLLIHYLTSATWSVVVRRFLEISASSFPLLAILFIPLLISVVIGDGSVYPWSSNEIVASDHHLEKKHGYLNVPFFVVRYLIYFAAWAAIARYFVRASIRQDNAGDASATEQLKRRSAPALLAVSVTLNFAAFDYLMSLTPHWSSTLYGVYFFAGAMVGGVAFLILAVCFVQAIQPHLTAITPEHYHDMGKLLFGFTFLWGYLAFSQYMLIWYANLPEETTWYAVRQNDAWVVISVALLFGHFIVPFLGLMSRWPKRNPKVLAAWALGLLVMHWLDLYWLIMPCFSPDALPFSILDLLSVVGVGLLLLRHQLAVFQKHSLIPVNDPHLAASMAFHNV